MKRISRRNLVLITAAVALMAGLTFAVYEQTGSRQPVADPTEFEPKRDSEGALRESRRTEQTTPAATDDTADTSANAPTGTPESKPAPKPQVKGSAKPIITGVDVHAGTIEVGAMTGGITSGTCTAVFTRSGYTEVTKTAPIELVATTYGCTMTLDRRLLANGTWTVRVSAESGAAAGTSDPQTVEVK